MTSQEAMEAECLHQFGVAPRTSDCRGSYINMTWIRNVKEGLILNDRVAMKKYVKCHILLLFGSILFADKSGSAVHWKFLPLLRDFSRIHEISWGSASLAHLYRALCRASRFDCKVIDGPLTLLHIWAWIRMPFLAPISRTPRFFPLANRWRNWEHHNWPYRYHTVAYFRRLLDEFVWEAYGVDRIEADVIPEDIRSQSEIWSATVPLILFETLEWHATDRCRTQFGFVQGVPHQERSLDGQHDEILIGSKNLDWSVTHRFWIMQWTNRYSHVLIHEHVPLHHPLELYMYWYRGKYGTHLHLSDLVLQEDQEGVANPNQPHEPEPQPSLQREQPPQSTPLQEQSRHL
ncbi:serine/threonine-protein phosphatase 7 long form homolog [Arachis duranensis]|uniref:Aminotransferase-like plant mobile domain-containing protein n=2 Tax=Arachis TaxID=3817 RepID=A0A445DVV5_ARAHY|nr:serine/threonine-protein phosphatase 7 long form homolog [Arachis duranensis]XP_025677978.1 serine/threonine-protein phosphatase 7 long form homolog [Arachis hypogaea]QHO57636.1 uncharacterized protein DS421_3g83920 [Arachis hypogaea]RYR67300.1 hypothetical protein Ahy_A03g013627 [Arachis hypogaea]